MFLVPFLEYSCYEYFPEIRSKGGSFVKYLLWHQNYFVMDYLAPPPPFLNLSPPPLCLIRQLIFKFFQHSHFPVF